jgi:3-isopropylmalate dehydrogenase
MLPGDGIGPEVMEPVRKLIEWMNANLRVAFEVDVDLVGGCSIDKCGEPIASETLAKAAQADAVLLGAVGGPKWKDIPFVKRPEAGLLRIRKELDLFANLRPSIVFGSLADASALKREYVEGLDIMIVRELIGGIYFGEPRGVETMPNGERRGLNTHVYTTSQIRRVARVAFDIARKRKKKVHSVEKGNVMDAGLLWREVVRELRDGEYPDVEVVDMYADNCTLQLVRNPKQFDVILTDNLFGDLLSDEAAGVAGSLGLLPSASLSDKKVGSMHAMYEPAHGSAPDIAGKGIANPIAALMSFGMMLRYSFDLEKEADALDQAVADVLDGGLRTPDLLMTAGAQRCSTEEMGAAILKAFAAKTR